MEHWLPLFHGKLETVFDYLPGSALALEHLAEDAARERFTQIADYYDARHEALKQGVTPPYKPLPAERLYLGESEWKERLETSAIARLTPFAVPESGAIDVQARQGRNFAAERAEPGANVFEAVAAHVLALQAAGKRVAVALWSEGARDRMGHVLADQNCTSTPVGSRPRRWASPSRRSRWRARHRFRIRNRDAAFISEQDILGDRRRPRRAARAGRKFHCRSDQSRARRSRRARRPRHRPLCRFAGDRSRRCAARLSRDPLRRRHQVVLLVENVDLFSRYGSEETNVELDRLGGGNWQARKARMKSRIREIAGELIKIARNDSCARRRVDRWARAPMTSSVPGSRTRRPTISSPPSTQPSRISGRAARWTGSFAAMSGSANRSGVARGLFGGHRRQAGRGRGADDLVGASALQDFFRAFAVSRSTWRRRRGWCPTRSSAR